MFRLTMTLPTLSGIDNRAWKRVLPRFEKEAGRLIVDAIHALLGTDALFTLKESYADKKQSGKTRPRMKQYAGKSWGEPLILDGSGIYEALNFRAEGETLIIEVDEGHGISERGFDYAEFWEQKTHYLEQGFAECEEELSTILLNIIFEEMGL